MYLKAIRLLVLLACGVMLSVAQAYAGEEFGFGAANIAGQTDCDGAAWLAEQCRRVSPSGETRWNQRRVKPRDILALFAEELVEERLLHLNFDIGNVSRAKPSRVHRPARFNIDLNLHFEGARLRFGSSADQLSMSLNRSRLDLQNHEVYARIGVAVRW